MRSGDISQGTWEFVFYTAIDPVDIIYSVIKGIVISFFVIITALYFGYRVRGGPVEVGDRDGPVDGGEPDPGHRPQHGHDLHLLGLQPEPPDRMRRRFRGDALAELSPVVARVDRGDVAIVLAVLAVAIIVTKQRGTYEVTAIFDSSRGLVVGGDVTAGCQKVGVVKDVTLGEDDGLPHVTMRIDGDFHLHQGAFADVRLTSNVGALNRVVDLTAGRPGGPRLADGDVLGPSQTDQPVDLDIATSTLDPRTRRDAAALLAGLDEATRGRGNDIAAILQHSSSALNETANVLQQVGYRRRRAALAGPRHAHDRRGARGRPGGARRDRRSHRRPSADRRRPRSRELRRSSHALGPALASGHRTLDNLAASVPDLRGLVSPLAPRWSRRWARWPTACRRRSSRCARRCARPRHLVQRAPRYARRLEPVAAASAPLVHLARTDRAPLQPPPRLAAGARTRGPRLLRARRRRDIRLRPNGHLIRFIPRFIQVKANTDPLGPSDTGPGYLDRPFFRTPGALENEAWDDYASTFIGGAQGVSP